MAKRRRIPKRELLALALVIVFGLTLTLGLKYYARIAGALNVGNPHKPPTQAMEKGAPEKAKDQIVVKYKTAVSETKKNDVAEAHAMTLKKKIDKIDYYVYKLPPQADAEATVAALKADPNVESAEQDVIAKRNDVRPNDPYYLSGYVGYLDLNKLPQAWSISTGDPGIIIAVLDTGVRGTHEDLQANMVPGRNVVSNNSDTTDIQSHGTAVAGVVGSVGNNGKGVVSSCWSCKVMPIRVENAGAAGAYTSDLSEGLIWAADHGARVANMSYGLCSQGVDYSSGVNAAAEYFRTTARGLITTSAGNEGQLLNCPDNPNLITVGSIGTDLAFHYYSNQGPFVDLTAFDIHGTTSWSSDSSYVTFSGTSAAAPHVASVLGLLLSANPALSVSEQEKLLFASTTDLGDSGRDPLFGRGGLYDVYKMLQWATGSQEFPPDTTPPAVTITAPVQEVTYTLSADNSYGLPVTVKAKDEAALSSALMQVTMDQRTLVTSPVTTTYDPVTQEYTFNLMTYGWSNGAHGVEVSVKDPYNNYAYKQVAFQIKTPQDFSAPSIKIMSPTDGATISGTTTFNVTALDDVGVTQVILSEGTNTIGVDTTSPYSFNVDTTKFSNGSHMFTATAYDASGKTSSWRTQVTINNTTGGTDTTAPTVSIASPANSSTVSGTATISVNAADNVGVKQVFASVDGMSLGYDTVSPYEFTWDTKTHSNSAAVISVTAEDAAGNMTTAKVTVTVSNTTQDTTVPTVTITSPTNGSTVKGNIKVTSTITDNVGVARAELWVDGAKYLTSYTSPYTMTFNTRKVSAGTHTLTVKAFDAAGNMGSATVTVTK